MRKHFHKWLACVLTLMVVISASLPSALAATWYAPGETISNSTLTLNDGSVLSVPSHAITQEYIVYRVRVGTMIYFYIDSFASADGVTEGSTQSFTRWRTATGSWSTSGALTSEDWVYYDHTDVAYLFSTGLFTKAVYSTFDYYDATGNLIIKGADSTLGDDVSEFEGTIEVELTNGDVIDIPRRLQGAGGGRDDNDTSGFFVKKPVGGGRYDTYTIYEFDDTTGVKNGSPATYYKWVGEYVTSGTSYGTYNLPSFEWDIDTYPYAYFLHANGLVDCYYLYLSPVELRYKYNSGDRLYITSSSSTYIKCFQLFDLEATEWYDFSNISCDGGKGLTVTPLWSNTDVVYYTDSSQIYLEGSSPVSSGSWSWSYEDVTDEALDITDSGTVVYTTFDLYGEDETVSVPADDYEVVTEDDGISGVAIQPVRDYDGFLPDVSSVMGDHTQYLIMRVPTSSDTVFDDMDVPTYPDTQRWTYYLYTYSDDGYIGIDTMVSGDSGTTNYCYWPHLRLYDSTIEVYRLESDNFEYTYISDDVLESECSTSYWSSWETYNDSIGLTTNNTTVFTGYNGDAFYYVLDNMLVACSEWFVSGSLDTYFFYGEEFTLSSFGWVAYDYTPYGSSGDSGDSGDSSSDNSGIIAWLEKIWNAITDGFNSVLEKLDIISEKDYETDIDVDINQDIYVDEDGNGSTFWDFLKSIVDGVFGTISSLFSTVTDAIGRATSSLGEFFDSLTDFEFFEPSINDDGSQGDSTYDEVGSFFAFMQDLWTCIPLAIRSFIVVGFSMVIFFAVFRMFF